MPKMANPRTVSTFLASAFLAFGIRHSALTAQPLSTRLSLYLLSHRIGEERSDITTTGDASVLRTHFEYVDRGTTVALDSTLTYRSDVTPLSFESHGKSYRYFSVDASVPAASTAPASFTLEGVAPVAAQGLLVRYWLAHGRPASIRLVPSGDEITVREVRDPLIGIDARRGPLREFTIDGLAWGRQRLWLVPARGTAEGEARNELTVAAAVTTVGVLGFEALAPSLDLLRVDTLIEASTNARLRELSAEARATPPLQRDTFALTNGRLIDATGGPAIEHATVIVRDGRIAATGPSDTTSVPRGVPVVDVSGKTILPGLWDMHA